MILSLGTALFAMHALAGLLLLICPHTRGLRDEKWSPCRSAGDCPSYRSDTDRPARLECSPAPAHDPTRPAHSSRCWQGCSGRSAQSDPTHNHRHPAPNTNATLAIMGSLLQNQCEGKKSLPSHARAFFTDPHAVPTRSPSSTMCRLPQNRSESS